MGSDDKDDFLDEIDQELNSLKAKLKKVMFETEELLQEYRKEAEDGGDSSEEMDDELVAEGKPGTDEEEAS